MLHISVEYDSHVSLSIALVSAGTSLAAGCRQVASELLRASY